MVWTWFGGPRSHYDVLGVPRSASPSLIRQAFLREAKKWHPDKRPRDESLQDREHAKLQFIAIHAAYEALGERPERPASSFEEESQGPTKSGDSTTASEGPPPAYMPRQPGQDMGSFAHMSREITDASQERVDVAFAARKEAEDYLADLLAQSRRKDFYSPEELQVLMNAFNMAHRAVWVLKARHEQAQHNLMVKKDLLASLTTSERRRSARLEDDLRFQRLQAVPFIPDDTIGSHLSGGVEALKEVVTDYVDDFRTGLSNFFVAWRVVREALQQGRRPPDQPPSHHLSI